MTDQEILAALIAWQELIALALAMFGAGGIEPSQVWRLGQRLDGEV